MAIELIDLTIHEAVSQRLRELRHSCAKQFHKRSNQTNRDEAVPKTASSLQHFSTFSGRVSLKRDTRKRGLTNESTSERAWLYPAVLYFWVSCLVAHG